MPSPDPRSLLKELNALENLRDNDVAAQRRQFKRFVIRGDAQLAEMSRVSSQSAPISVMLRDLSRGGVGFISDKPIDSGSYWTLRLMHQGYAVAETAVTVRHGRMIKEGVYLVGSQICMSHGMMVLMGVDPMETDNSQDGASFLAPNEATNE